MDNWWMQNPPLGYQTVSPYLLYEDAPSAIEHLKSAYGFVERRSQLGAAGRMHAELLLGNDGLVMVGQAWEGFSSPKSLGAHPPTLIHVYVQDIEALHKRARQAGAEASDLEMSPAGDRRFTATDIEGQGTTPTSGTTVRWHATCDDGCR